ncbi:MAG: 4Fe-4S binding protein [Acidobacteriota bacterium]
MIEIEERDIEIKAVEKNADSSFRIRPYRKLVQIGFLMLTLLIGAQFILFVGQLESGQIPNIPRPPGVEAFLPISALISLKYWILSGIYNTIHPASLTLLLIILATAFFLKKGFCSWVCPFGLLSEFLFSLRKFLSDRYLYLGRWLDYPLRSLKYLLLLFFLWAIFVQMNTGELRRFLYSPYNQVADIKMLKFFSEISITTFWVLVILFLLSILIPYSWCRYLCPYGALLGALSWLSPWKIHRDDATCIDCKKCTKACPANIKVHKAGAVFSDECHACLQCVDACPVKDTVYISVTRKKFRLPRLAYAMLLVLLFLTGTTLARWTGRWHSSISIPQYQYHIMHLKDPQYHHNRGRVPDYEGSYELGADMKNIEGENRLSK